MRVSVVICTKDRPADLLNCINSILVQSVQPAEIVIVDASEKSIEKQIRDILSIIEVSPELLYLQSAPGLPYQRNLGVKASSGDIVFFFDDDVVLDNLYIEKTLEVYGNYGEAGGTQGAFITSFRPHYLGMLLRRIFLLQLRPGKGVMLPSGFPSHEPDSSEVIPVEVMCGGNTSYRREVLEGYCFDENLSGWAFMEDTDFSYRVSRNWRLYHTPFSKLEHFHSPTSRVKRQVAETMQVVNHYYLFRKNLPPSFLNNIAFAWSELGSFILVAIHLDKDASIGRLKGLGRVIKNYIQGDNWQQLLLTQTSQKETE